MEKTASQDQPQQQPPTVPPVVPPLLRCPRCDSSNTKFCYYNNYSLSQPRHFCKACKRYWTRGGTLRNVPVGGGCRKNKRLKRRQSLDLPGAKDKSIPGATTIITTCTTSTTSSVTSTATPASINKSSSSIFNQFAGLSSFAPVSAASGRPVPAGLVEGLNISSNGAGVDLPPMLNSLWFNYPANATATSHHLDYINQNPNPIQELLPTDHYPLLSSPPSSLLATTLQQQKMAMGMRESRAINEFQVFFPAVLDLHQSPTINHGSSSFSKGFKMDQEGHINQVPCTTNTTGLPLPSSEYHHFNSSYWNAGGVAGASYWPEVTNFGPSITPLI